MYSKTVIKQNLDVAQNLINSRPKGQQFTLRAYTPSESSVLTDHLTSIYSESEKTWTRALTSEEYFFIENERILSKYNFLYWLRRYVYILSSLDPDNPDAMIHFKPNKAQLIMHDIMGELEDFGAGIMLLALKGRQVGITTFSEAAVLHRVQFYEDVRAIAASSDPDKSRVMVEEKIRLPLIMQPHWLTPTLAGPYESGELYIANEAMNSSLELHHGAAMSGIARGRTPTVAHLTELADFKDAAADIDAALLQAIHEHPRILYIMESTGTGDEENASGVWLQETWETAVELWTQKRGRIFPMFLPYFTAPDVWPAKSWLKKIPIPENWKPQAETIAHAQKAAEYVQSVQYLSSRYPSDWTLPIEQQWFWECTRDEFKRKRQLHIFYQEMASSPSDSFVSSGYSIITIEERKMLEGKAKPLALYHGAPATFAIVGPGIVKYEPRTDTLDLNRPPIVVKSDWADGRFKSTYRLLPLKYNPNAWENVLFVWEMPRHQNSYATGIDCGEGIGKDRTVIEVLRRGTNKTKAEQVAEFSSSQISAINLVPFANAIGTFYSLNTPRNVNQCKQAIELACAGNALQNQLQLLGWGNFHQWKGAYDKASKKPSVSLGWVMNWFSRQFLIETTKAAILDGYLQINSNFFIDEFANLQRPRGKSKIAAYGKAHDDRFFAGGIAFVSLHDLDVYERYQGDISFHIDETASETLAAAIQRHSEINQDYIPKPPNADAGPYIIDNYLPTLPD